MCLQVQLVLSDQVDGGEVGKRLAIVRVVEVHVEVKLYFFVIVDKIPFTFVEHFPLSSKDDVFRSIFVDRGIIAIEFNHITTEIVDNVVSEEVPVAAVESFVKFPGTLELVFATFQPRIGSTGKSGGKDTEDY